MDGLFYVPSAVTGEISVLKLESNRTLSELHRIKDVPMPIDNLFVDTTGRIFAAGSPKVMSLIESMDNFTVNPPSTIWGIEKLGNEYKTTKVLEDSEAKVLPGSTVALHDAKTGRLFLGG